MELQKIKSLTEAGETLYLEKADLDTSFSMDPERNYPRIIWIDSFLSLTGSCMYDRENGREPNDIDLVVRADPDNDGFCIKLDASLRIKIDRIIAARFGDKETQWIGSPQGPNWKHQPIYDLALIPKKIKEPVEMNEPDFADEFYKEFSVFAKKDDERVVCGIVYAPDKMDLQGDRASAEEIKKAAWSFMENGGVYRFNHRNTEVKATTLETFIAPLDYTVQKNNGAHVAVKKGSWVLIARVNDPTVWNQIKSGEIKGYSMAGKHR